MTKTQAIQFFGSPGRVADILGVTRGAVSQWGERLPGQRQYQLAEASGGVLEVDPDLRIDPVTQVAA